MGPDEKLKQQQFCQKQETRAWKEEEAAQCVRFQQKKAAKSSAQGARVPETKARVSTRTHEQE